MNIADCRTTSERDVLITYRRMLRRKDVTPFHAMGLALAEELTYGADLSPDFVERFTDGTRTFDKDGRLVLTPVGRSTLMSIADNDTVSTVERNGIR